MAFNNSGSGARTVNMGSGTWTFTAASGTVYDQATSTNLTFSGTSAALVFTATTASVRTFATGTGQTFGSVTLSANTSGGTFNITSTGSATLTNLAITAPNFMKVTGAATLTLTNAPTASGSSSNQIGISPVTPGGGVLTVASANNIAFSWCGLRDITFTGGTHTATNSFNLGIVTGITITPPATGGGLLRHPGVNGGLSD